jgi:hypothetical protein
MHSMTPYPLDTVGGDYTARWHGDLQPHFDSRDALHNASYSGVAVLAPLVLPASTAKRAPAGRQAVRMRAVGTWLVNSEARGEAQ